MIHLLYTMPKIWVMCALSFLIGCTSSSPPLNSITISFKSNGDLNPDVNGRPSPVDICIFQLRNSDHFLQSQFFDLYTPTSTTLDKSVVEEHNVEIAVNQTQKLTLTLDEETRYLGFLVAYYDIKKAKWREVRSLSTLKEDLAITLNAHDFLIQS